MRQGLGSKAGVGCLLLCGGLLALLGCGGSNQPNLKPVTGKVIWKGKALAGAGVQFIPNGSTGGGGGSGKTDANGQYTITYVRGQPGLLPGSYKVVVSKRVMPDGSEPPADVPPIESPAREVLPARYSDPHQTQLTRTVPESGGAIDITLK